MKKYQKLFKLIIIIIILFTIYFGIKVLLKQRLVFYLKGEEFVTLPLNKAYSDQGFVAKSFGKNLEKYVRVKAKIDNTFLDEYEVTYTLEYKKIKKTLTRYVRVVDTTLPTLKLVGKNPLVLEVGEDFDDPGVIALDNIDEEIQDKVQVINYVNKDEEGVYEIIYKASDESGNTASINRMVYVVKNKEDYNYLDLLKKGDITYMQYTENGFWLKGYHKEDDITSISLCKAFSCYENKMLKTGEFFYEGQIDLSSLKNGLYTLVLNNKEDATTSLNERQRLYRGKIKDKLVTFIYDQNIKIKIEDFAYEYDVVIDPGHGGDDEGASNKSIQEKDLNLLQSLYEKQRYEQMGLKVLLLRDDDKKGLVMGSEDYPFVTRKGFAVGYYGSVSKVVYSNHHNSNDVPTLSGWEIIVPATSTTKDLSYINKIASKWQANYQTKEKHIRVFARNYNEGMMFGKEQREMYYFTNYYAVMRIPYDLFNTHNFIFEGCYLSNEEDFDYYYNNDNWQNFSEMKIKEVVEYLGKKYIAK